MFGLAWIAVLSALGWSDRAWVAVLRRGIFLVGVSVILGATTVIVAASNGVDNFNPTRTGVWFYCLGCAIPVTVLAFLVARSAFNRMLLGAVGTLAALVFLAAGGAAFREYGKPIDGFAMTAHDHHALVISALVFPLLLLGAACWPFRSRGDVELSTPG